MTETETAKLLALLREYYPRDVEASSVRAKVRAWYLVLRDWPYEAVQAAALAFVANDTRGFMPAPGQVLEKLALLAEPEGPTAAEAWNLVKCALGNGLYGAGEEFARLPEDVQRLVGSPGQLREWAMMDIGTLDSVVASNFRRAYEAVWRRRQEASVLPAEVRTVLGGLSDSLAPEREAGAAGAVPIMPGPERNDHGGEKRER